MADDSVGTLDQPLEIVCEPDDLDGHPFPLERRAPRSIRSGVIGNVDLGSAVLYYQAMDVKRREVFKEWWGEDEVGESWKEGGADGHQE